MTKVTKSLQITVATKPPKLEVKELNLHDRAVLDLEV